MFEPRRIIKEHTLKGTPLPSAFVEESLGQPLRIPGQRVRQEQRPEAHEEEPEFRLRGVLRGAQARLATRPRELTAPDLTPDFPLPPPEEEPEEEAPPPPDLETLQAEWDAAWQARLEAAVAEAQEEAYAQGYADGQASLEAAFQENVTALAEDMHRVEAAWQSFMEQSEPLLTELSFEVAQCVLDAPLPPGIKGVVSRALVEAVEHLSGHPPIQISLHPVDFLRLQEAGVVEQLELLHSGIRWEPTPDLKPGDWVAQSPTAAFRRLEGELINTLRSRLGLLAAVEKRKEDRPHKEDKTGREHRSHDE